MTASGPPPVAWESPPDRADGPAPGVEFAPHGARFVAYLLDSVIVLVICVALLIVMGLAVAGGATFSGGGETVEIDGSSILAVVALLLGIVVLVLLYFPFFWAHGGQTPGMRVFGLVVVRDVDGGRIGWGTALLRTLGMYVASAVFYLGFIWILVDKRRRGFHDLIAGTVVVKRS